MSVREPGVHVEFVMHPVLHGQESKSAGREVYVDKPHVRIRVAGMDKDEFFGPVTEQKKQRFPEEWAAFERGIAAPVVGTPIERWPYLFSKPSQMKNLLSVGFKTVEDLAAAADAALQSVGMGGFKLRDEARKFLSGAQVQAEAQRLEDLEKANAALQAQVDALIAAQKQADEKPKRKAREEAAT